MGNTTTAPLQTVDYTYNIRGWLKRINNPLSLGNDLFAFKINYNTQDHGATALYNGNISETEWRTANSDNSLKWYTYSYDPLNGNITSLSRDGHTNTVTTSFGLMENLIYTYASSSNKLTKVKDNGNDTFGFRDGADVNDELTYDVNGNLKSDANKGITEIQYNHLNMPSKITVSGANAGVFDYKYSADGIKLRKIKNRQKIRPRQIMQVTMFMKIIH